MNLPFLMSRKAMQVQENHWKKYMQRKELTPEEGALEDRLVTMAEYGAELKQSRP